MDDLISRQAAIKELREMAIALYAYDATSVISCAIYKLQNLPSVQQWIPVTERLPKDDDWQIVTVLDESGDTPFRYTHVGWYLDVANCWIVDAEQRNDVSAWMPLPECYRGEE